MRLALLAPLLAFALPCAAQAPPRLVVLLVVDGMPQRQLVDYREQLAPGGFRRFLEKGTWFAEAHYAHANTLTCPGHAVMLTGAYPHRTGIIGNEWRDPATGGAEYCAADPAHTYLGHRTHRLDGTSPRNLRSETLGDVLRRTRPASKVVAVAGKDRGAIMPAGRSGVAYMFQAETGRFASTTYYMKEHPGWVEAFAARKLADGYFGQEWKPLLPDASYARSVPDGQSWYGKGGFLPRTLGAGLDKPGPLFYGALPASPFGDALTLEFARAALAGERLGRDDAPDILSVSLSGHDYVNHAYGPESRISHDHVLQVDRFLERFFAHLDAVVGRDRYVAVLTADHGFAPAPEYQQSLGREAGRVKGREMLARLDAALAAEFGTGPWALGFSANGLVVDRSRIERTRIDAEAFLARARDLLVAEPGIAAAYTRAELTKGMGPEAPFFEAIRRSWHPERSADIAFAWRENWIPDYNGTGTTHGSPHRYDTHVPMAFYGPRWVGAGRIDAPAEVADIAPTLARILRIPPPADSEGRAHSLARPPKGRSP